MSKDTSQFVYMTCRAGAERAVKAEVARVEPAWRFSYSRPGLVTFKHTGQPPLSDRQIAEQHWTFAHAHGLSLGRLIGDRLGDLAASVWNHEAVKAIHGSEGFNDIHVWQLDAPSEEVEIDTTPLCQTIEVAVRAAASSGKVPQVGFDDAGDGEKTTRQSSDSGDTTDSPHRKFPSRRNSLVLDIIVLAAGEWWLGYHRAVRKHERWPGGAIPLSMPYNAVSRAYLKMKEALAWSDLPLEADDECVEIGCAPGGASQALLERGLFVTGIDPAEVDAIVLAHPRFRHLKKRGKDVRRKEFEGVRWLAADMNIAPEATLDEVEAIVTHPGITIRGLVLTLKLSDWKLADQVPGFADRVRGWGFREVRVRQLTTGGQEVCLVALKRKALRRLSTKSRRRRNSTGQRKLRRDMPQSRLQGPHF